MDQIPRFFQYYEDTMRSMMSEETIIQLDGEEVMTPPTTAIPTAPPPSSLNIDSHGEGIIRASPISSDLGNYFQRNDTRVKRLEDCIKKLEVLEVKLRDEISHTSTWLDVEKLASSVKERRKNVDAFKNDTFRGNSCEDNDCYIFKIETVEDREKRAKKNEIIII